jgi:hypothetical protein
VQIVPESFSVYFTLGLRAAKHVQNLVPRAPILLSPQRATRHKHPSTMRDSGPQRLTIISLPGSRYAGSCAALLFQQACCMGPITGAAKATATGVRAHRCSRVETLVRSTCLRAQAYLQGRGCCVRCVLSAALRGWKNAKGRHHGARITPRDDEAA